MNGKSEKDKRDGSEAEDTEDWWVWIACTAISSDTRRYE
jgi:hypothetical protein